MNKHIKYKKKGKLDFKRYFTKEERLLYKKFPRLLAVHMINKISMQEINYAWKKIKKLKTINKNQFENMMRIIVVANREKWTFSEGSYGQYIVNLFNELSIKL